jgi:hypothetical protein
VFILDDHVASLKNPTGMWALQEHPARAWRDARKLISEEKKRNEEETEPNQTIVYLERSGLEEECPDLSQVVLG